MNPKQPDSRKRKAVLELFELGKEGIPPGDKEPGEKTKVVFPYGHGLSLLTRIRLFLRVLNLRKLKKYIFLGSTGWLLFLGLMFEFFSDIPRLLVTILFFPPWFLAGCLGFLILYRREYPHEGYNGLSTKRGWFAITQGLFLMVCGFSVSVYLIIQIIEIITTP